MRWSRVVLGSLQNSVYVEEESKMSFVHKGDSLGDYLPFLGDDMERVVCPLVSPCELWLIPRWALTVLVFPLFGNGPAEMHRYVSYLAEWQLSELLFMPVTVSEQQGVKCLQCSVVPGLTLALYPLPWWSGGPRVDSSSGLVWSLFYGGLLRISLPSPRRLQFPRRCGDVTTT